MALIYLLKCICCDDDYIDSDEELEQQKQQLLALTMKSRKAGLVPLLPASLIHTAFAIASSVLGWAWPWAPHCP